MTRRVPMDIQRALRRSQRGSTYGPLPLYEKCCAIAEGVLVDEGVFNSMQPGESYLWLCRSHGTHLRSLNPSDQRAYARRELEWFDAISVNWAQGPWCLVECIENEGFGNVSLIDTADARALLEKLANR